MMNDESENCDGTSFEADFHRRLSSPISHPSSLKRCLAK
jgi:hypothetical protein